MQLIARLRTRYFTGNRDLLLLWIGQLAAGFGDSLTFMGFLFLALQLTGSEEAVGAFQSIAYIPIALFGLAAGVYVDRRDRKRVMLVSDGARALALLAIPLMAVTGTLGIVGAGVSVMVVTTMTAFFNPAYNSALPIIVGDPARLFGVNALMQSSRQFAAIAGPVFAAIGAGRSGPVALLGANIATYLVSFVCIAFISTPLRARASADASGEADGPLPAGDPADADAVPGPTPRARRGDGIALADLIDGVRNDLRVVMRHRGVRIVFLLTLVNNLLLMGPAFVGTPLLVKNVFGGGLSDYAIVELMYALGMTITGVLLHQFPNVRRLGLLWAFGLVLDGFTFVPYLWAPSLSWLYGFTFLHALAIPLIIVTRATMIQRLVPQEVLGRAFGYIDIAVLGITALSAGLTGFACAHFGARLVIVYGGILAGCVGIVALLTPTVRRIAVGVRGEGRGDGAA